MSSRSNGVRYCVLSRRMRSRVTVSPCGLGGLDLLLRHPRVRVLAKSALDELRDRQRVLAGSAEELVELRRARCQRDLHVGSAHVNQSETSVNTVSDYAGVVKETVEREVKLAAGEGFMLPELGGEARPTRVFVSTYHDTPELALARHGITFRHRIEDGAGVWQLKLPRAGDVRVELERAGPACGTAAGARRAAARAPARRRARPRGAAADAPRGRSRRRRGGRRRLGRGARPPAGHAPLPRDRGRASRRGRADAAPAREGATPRGRQRGGLHAQALPGARSRLPARGGRGAGAMRRPPRRWRCGCASRSPSLVSHDPGTRLGSDPEDLHQLRVADPAATRVPPRGAAAARTRAPPRISAPSWRGSAVRSGLCATSTS